MLSNYTMVLGDDTSQQTNCVSASAVVQCAHRINKYQKEIDNIGNMLLDEIERILEKNIYYSGSIFDDGKQEYLDALRKQYGILNIQNLLSLKILNNHNWKVCFSTNNAHLESTSRCKDIDFIFNHQRGLRDFTLVYLTDDFYFVRSGEDDGLQYTRVEIHSKNLPGLLDFIHENNLKVKINKKSASNDLTKSIEKTSSVLDFLNKI